MYFQVDGATEGVMAIGPWAQIRPSVFDTLGRGWCRFLTGLARVRLGLVGRLLDLICVIQEVRYIHFVFDAVSASLMLFYHV